MKPINFPQSNIVFNPPPGLEEECGPCPAFVGEFPDGLEATIVCWELTDEELDYIFINNHIFLYFVGHLLVPHGILQNNPFVPQETEKPTIPQMMKNYMRAIGLLEEYFQQPFDLGSNTASQVLHSLNEILRTKE